MDKGTTGLTPLFGGDAEHAAAIEREIESIRGNLDTLMSELDQRRHRLSPIRLARRHPSLFALAGIVVLAGMVGSALFAYRTRQRSLHSWRKRGERFRDAFDRLAAGKPIEKPPGIARKAAVAAISAGAAIAGRQLAKRFFPRA